MRTTFESIASVRPIITTAQLSEFIASIVPEDFHAKRVLTLSNAALGVLQAGALTIHAIGRGLAVARGLDDKHTVKQVDRLLSNSGFDVERFCIDWVRDVVAGRTRIIVNMEWCLASTTLTHRVASDDFRTHCLIPFATSGPSRHLLPRRSAYPMVAGPVGGFVRRVSDAGRVGLPFVRDGEFGVGGAVVSVGDRASRLSKRPWAGWGRARSANPGHRAVPRLSIGASATSLSTARPAGR